jgi:tetratricopeptide (TPR) repeat protein
MEKLPFLALMAVGLFLTSMSQRTADTIYTREQYPLIQSLVQPGFRVSFYVWKTLLPIHLSPLYLYRPEFGLQHVLGWVMILGVTGGLIAERKRVPGALVAWLSFGLMIAPVCGLFQAGPHYAHDIWSYLPCTPFAALFGGGLLLPAQRKLLQGCGVGAVVILGALAVLSVRQTPVYETSLKMWDTAIHLDPDAYYSWHQRGRAKAEKNDVDGAIEDFSRSISLRSGYPDPWHERGLAWTRKNRQELAAEDFQMALKIDPTRVNSAYQLGLAELRLGMRDEALARFSRAIELRPGFPEALLQRARLRAFGGDLKGALADMDAVLGAVSQAPLYLERATIRAIGGDLEGAIADCSESIRLQPDYADAWARRGVARMERGDSSGAARDFARALELAPKNWPARREIEQALRRVRNSN